MRPARPLRIRGGGWILRRPECAGDGISLCAPLAVVVEPSGYPRAMRRRRPLILLVALVAVTVAAMIGLAALGGRDLPRAGALAQPAASIGFIEQS